MNHRLYVGNLSSEVTSESVQAYFGEFGTVKEAHVVIDRETGRARGFAFVTMNNAEEASCAIAELNHAMFEGRPLHVTVADERSPRSGGAGGRAGGGAGGAGGAGRAGGRRGGERAARRAATL